MPGKGAVKAEFRCERRGELRRIAGGEPVTQARVGHEMLCELRAGRGTLRTIDPVRRPLPVGIKEQQREPAVRCCGAVDGVGGRGIAEAQVEIDQPFAQECRARVDCQRAFPVFHGLRELAAQRAQRPQPQLRRAKARVDPERAALSFARKIALM